MKKSKKVFILILSALIISNLISCQPNPEKSVVIKKDNAEKEIVESAKQYDDIESIDFSYEVPEHVTDRYNIVKGYLDIRIDADVNMPDIERVPVARAKSVPFTQDRAEELLGYFMQGGKLVTPWVRTKADYDKDIIRAKEKVKSGEDFGTDNDPRDWLENLIERRENAPDEDIRDEICDYNIFQENGLSGRIIIDDEIAGNVFITEDYFSFGSSDFFRVADRNNYDEETGEIIDMPQKDINMTEQQAIDRAYELFDDIGLSNMCAYKTEKIYFVGDDYYGDIKYGGYHLTFTRGFGGIMPFVLDGYCMSKHDTYDAALPAELEKVTVTVDENYNIKGFMWQNPVEIIETITEHVDILPFEDIMARLEEFSKIQFAYLGGYSSSYLCLKDIYDISFRITYMPIKNNPAEFMYMPCWVFTYKDWQEYTDEQLELIKENGGWMIHWDEMADDVIVFSAVDGASVAPYTIEDLDKMYNRNKATPEK